MSADDASLSARETLRRLLERRAELLRPTEDTISRALRRCVRHDLRSQRRSTGRNALESAAAVLPGGAATVRDGGEAVEEAPAFTAASEAVTQDDAPIATAVAQARTVSDSLQPEGAPTEPATQVEPIDPSRPTTRRRTRRLEAGRVVGGYRIEGLLGSGGMGQVYRATQLSMNRQVALKVLSPRYTENTRFRERFLREARFAGSLQHPNLIAVHDVGESDGLLYFSMEMIDGRNARDLLADLPGGRMEDDQVWAIAEQACEALRYAHGRGVIHRDVKPDNLMITRSDGTVKLADLGLSRRETEDGEDDGDFTTKTGTMMGTPYYMPPEQGRDAHRADQRADLYSLGASLYHLGCGHVPFEGETAVAILINASTQPLHFSEPGPGPALRAFIEALMAKQPAARPASAGEALELLRRLRAGKTVRSGAYKAVIPEPVSAPVPATRRRSGPILLSIVALIAVAAVVVWQVLDPARVVRQRVQDFSDTHRYAAALAEIDLAIESGLDAGMEALRGEVTAAWDTWALAQAADAFAAVDSALSQRDVETAQRGLDRIARSEGWRSPAVLERIDRLEQSLGDLALRQGSQEDRARFTAFFAQRWLGAIFGDKAEISETRATLRGQDRVLLGGRGATRGLLADFALTVQAAEGQRLFFTQGATAVRIDADGVFLDRGDASQRLAPPTEAGSTVVIGRRGDQLVLQAGEQRHLLGSGETILGWEAGDADLVLDLQIQRPGSRR